MTKLSKFQTGFCSTDHHDYCRGALRRPNDDQGNERLLYCICSCHKGKEIVLEEEIVRVLNPRKEAAAETAEWYSKLVIHGHVEIDATESDYKAKAARIRKAAKEDGTVEILTRFTNGQLVVKVKPARKTAKRKSSTTSRKPARVSSTTKRK